LDILCRHGIVQVIHNWTYNASDISLLWQVPQYCLVGSAEVFAGVAGKSVICYYNVLPVIKVCEQ